MTCPFIDILKRVMKNLVKQKRIIKGVLSSVIIISTLLCESSAIAITLEEAIAIAVKNYPSMQEARFERNAIRGDLDTAKANYYPSIDLGAGIGPEWTDNPTTRRTNEDDRWLTRKESSLRLTQILFDGYERTASVEEQEALLEGAVHNVDDRGDTIGSDVAFSYIDVLRHSEILQSAEESLKVHAQILDYVKQRVDAGHSGMGDLQQARAREANAKSRIAKITEELDKAKITFNRLVGRMPDSLVRPDFDDGILPKSVGMAIQVANEKSSLIKRVQSRMEAAKAQVKASSSGNYPTFLLDIGGRANDDLDGQSGRDNDIQAMLRMEMNLFRGGADSAKQRAAAERYSKSMSVLAETRRKVEEEVRRAWSTKQSQDDEEESRLAEVLANGQVADIYGQEFQLGLRDLLDLLVAENELFKSRSLLISTQSSALYSRFLLLASMGVLMESLGIPTQEGIQEDGLVDN